MYKYPGVLWTTQFVNSTVEQARWMLEMPWQLALTAGWTELVDQKYNRHVWTTNLTVVIDDEFVWQYPVEVQVPQVPVLGTVFSVTANETGAQIFMDTPYMDFAQLRLVVPIIAANTSERLVLQASNFMTQWTLVEVTDNSTCVIASSTGCAQRFNLLIPLQSDLPADDHVIVSLTFGAVCSSCASRTLSASHGLLIDFDFGSSNIRSVVTLHFDYQGEGEVLNVAPASVFTVYEEILVRVQADQLPLYRNVFVQAVLGATMFDALTLVIDNELHVLIENGVVTALGETLALTVVEQTAVDAIVSISFADKTELIATNETQVTLITGVLTQQVHQINFIQSTLWPVYTLHNITVIIPPLTAKFSPPQDLSIEVLIPAIVVPAAVLCVILGLLLWFVLIAAGKRNHYCLQY
jgi:hypothetical protein